MINGIINVYKEQGFTSHDVVAKLRGILKQKKIGHTGTLDPDAVGVLPVCLGKGTKLCDLLTDKDKTYEAVLLLGQVTDTQDTSGTILSQKEVISTEDEIRQAIGRFVGEIQQVPPMYSALKVNGRKLCDLAREGIEVERKARPVTIFSIDVLDVNTVSVMNSETKKQISMVEVRMTVHCSKGTYIRTLCNDIGEVLGCGGCMKELCRTQVANFVLSDSLKLDEIAELVKEDRIDSIVVPVDGMFPDAMKIQVQKESCKYLYNGNSFTKRHIEGKMDFEDGQRVRVYDSENQFIALYSYHAKDQCFKVVKMFY